MGNALVRKTILAIADVLIINAVIIVVVALHWDPEIHIHAATFSTCIRIVPWLAMITVAVFSVAELYHNWLRKSRAHLLQRVLAAVITVAVVAMLLSTVDRIGAPPPRTILAALPFQIAFIASYRTLLWRIRRKFSRSRRLLIIGSDDQECEQLSTKFEATHGSWFEFRELLPAASFDGLDSLLPTVDVVAFSASFRRRLEVMARCAALGKEVLIVPEMFELLIFHAEQEAVDDVLMLSIRPMRLTAFERATKRMLDIVGSAVLILLTSPIQLLLCVLIPLLSRGSPIFRQERVGENGQTYTIHKFRTMVDGAEKATGPTLVTQGDPRITGFGSLLRSTRMDELPQLFDVLRGVMSLVGPRPERPFFVDQFRVMIPDYDFRFAVKPGITGLAQINGRYTTTVQDKLRFDLLYIHEFSLLLDFTILLQTVRAVLLPSSASGLPAYVSTRPAASAARTSAKTTGVRAPARQAVGAGRD